MKEIYPFLILFACVALASLLLVSNISGNYRFEKTYLSEWELADKSSTIQAKREHIGLFLAALKDGRDSGQFASHNAIWMKTDNNGFSKNLAALESLSGRLDEIQAMDPKSFEYNTAIQQITAQEQGEAHRMIGVFDGCFKLSQYPMAWDWICVVLTLASVGGLCLVSLLGFIYF